MLKIAIMSDLHLEFNAQWTSAEAYDAGLRAEYEFYLDPPQPDADFLVLAGDIHDGMLAIEWAFHHFSIPTVLISGDHEAFGHELFRVIKHNRMKAAETNGRVIYLERAAWAAHTRAGERVRFIGATLWSDFRLQGAENLSMALAQQRLEDFRAIKIERGFKQRPLSPSDTARLHNATVGFIREELSRPFPGKTIVISHHAPSPRSIPPMYLNDPLTPAFVSNLEELICSYQPSLWVHGHVHQSLDYLIGRTRVICNPRGYFPNELNPSFNPNLVVDI